MIYTPLTKKAMCFAYQAHHGQLDCNGVPYIFHPIHVAEQMEEEISCCAALLHDVLEDTPVTREELLLEFPEAVVEAVCLLTRREGEDYPSYIRRLRQNPAAVQVKLADLVHNLDQTRCAGTDISPARLKAWKDKYTSALALLTE